MIYIRYQHKVPNSGEFTDLLYFCKAIPNQIFQDFLRDVEMRSLVLIFAISQKMPRQYSSILRLVLISVKLFVKGKTLWWRWNAM